MSKTEVPIRNCLFAAKNLDGLDKDAHLEYSKEITKLVDSLLDRYKENRLLLWHSGIPEEVWM